MAVFPKCNLGRVAGKTSNPDETVGLVAQAKGYRLLIVVEYLRGS